MHGAVRGRVRDIFRQVYAAMGVTIINGLLSYDHVHMFVMFVEIPPRIAVSHFVQRAKARSSRKIQQEFEHIRKRYWSQRCWARGYFCATSGNVTDEVIMHYLDYHTAPTEKASATHAEPTGANRLSFSFLDSPSGVPASDSLRPLNLTESRKWTSGDSRGASL
ncbi:hypothetical protein GCM10009087_41150 [Sphingomonas oligophenolica]